MKKINTLTRNLDKKRGNFETSRLSKKLWQKFTTKKSCCILAKVLLFQMRLRVAEQSFSGKGLGECEVVEKGV